MEKWDQIHKEAAALADSLVRLDVDLSEAHKLVEYYKSKNYDDRATALYLSQMSTNPPPRSRRSRQHFQNMSSVWSGWRTQLKGHDKAAVWGWAVRLAKSIKAGV